MPELSIMQSIGLWPIPFAWLLSFLERGLLLKSPESARSPRFANITFQTLITMVYNRAIPLYEFGLACSYFDSAWQAPVGVEPKLQKIAQTINAYVGRSNQGDSQQERMNPIPIWNRWMSTHPRYCLMVILNPM